MGHQKQDKNNDVFVTKKYSTLSNMIYVIKYSVQEQKVLAPLLVLYALITAIIEYVPAIVNSLIILILEKNIGIEKLAISVLIMFIIAVVLYEIGIYTKSQLDWRYFFARVKFINKILHKLMNIDYELLEQPKVLEAQQKALRTTSGSNYGIQGMLDSSIKNIVNILKVIIAISLVLTQDPYIVTIVVILTILHFIWRFIHSLINWLVIIQQYIYLIVFLPANFATESLYLKMVK